MADKLRLIDAEITACRSKMAQLGTGLLRAENATPDALTLRQPMRSTPSSLTIFPYPFTVFIRKSKIVKVLWRQVVSEVEKKRQFEKLIEMKAFKDWCDNFEQALLDQIDFEHIYIHDCDFAGPTRLLFLKFSTDMKYNNAFVEQFRKLTPHKNTPSISDIVFMRGASVAILMVLKCEDGFDRVILTKQTRVPVGKYALEEIPAGMLDESGDFAGVAAKEIQEETGLTIHTDDLVPLTPIASSYPSPGGCDEGIRFFLYQPVLVKTYTREEITALQNKNTGNLEEGEVISLNIVKLQELREYTQDMKTMAALYLYDKYTDRPHSYRDVPITL